MNITESIKFDKLKAENEALKKELDELKQQILYKEDFTNQCLMCFYDSCLNKGHAIFWKYLLKDTFEYYKLPSKDVKYEKVK
ncbi:hypothetical protein [Spiroplasma phoeniceum]|uniref:Uncharacterized protein n=1 Tax=Spiroplasma phoeniceum P40 TaxID=1276259 RepID=A0A345DN08_9MOLU|nr:hypothetical protein [Spiroplasma phoeniceum]AXF95596.1 hypothetical protein SDAV_00605 [Spiroplasma phoeniceum P40]